MRTKLTLEQIEAQNEVFDRWAEAGGTAAHPYIKRALYEEAKRVGARLPGMK